MIRTLIVGFGFMGQTHAKVYHQLPGVKVVAIVDANTRATEKTMLRMGLKAPLFSNLAAACESLKIDIVDICLPTDLHATVALSAIRLGKHLFCEKPLALNLEDAGKIVRAAKEAKIFSQIGHCIRFWPEYQAFEQFVRSKKAGALKSLTLQRRAARPSYAIGQWLLDPKRSGGAAMDLHIHDTDFILHLLGKPGSVQSHVTRDEHGPSHIFTTYNYGKGLQVTAEGGWNYPPQWGFQMAFQAVFENGTVEYDSNANPTLTVTMGNRARKPLRFHAPRIKSQASGGNISALGGYFNELQYFTSCVAQGKAPTIATIEQAKESLSVVLAELESARKSSPVFP